MPVTKKAIQDEIATRSFVEGLSGQIKLLLHPSKVLKAINKTIQVFDITIKQPDVAAVARRYRDGIKRLELDVTRATVKGERAQFFTTLCRTLNLKTIIPAAASARDYGYTVFEINWKHIDGKTLPVSLTPKPRHWFRFDTENRLRLLTREAPDGIDVETTWPRKFIAVVHERSLENPYGQGLLDEAYWYAKALAANFEYHIGWLEDDGRDHWLGWVPSGTDDPYKAKVETTLRKLRNAAVAVLEEGTRIEKVENKGRTSTSDAFEVFKKSCRGTLNFLWLGSDLTTNAQGTGAYASTQSGIAIEDDAIDAGKELVEELMNTLFAYVTELNTLPGTEDEQISFILKKPVDQAQQASIDKTYADATGMTPSDQLLVRRGYEKGDFVPKSSDLSIGIAATPTATFESGYDIGALTSAAEALKKKR
jgi:phage gp29-like protein